MINSFLVILFYIFLFFVFFKKMKLKKFLISFFGFLIALFINLLLEKNLIDFLDSLNSIFLNSFLAFVITYLIIAIFSVKKVLTKIMFLLLTILLIPIFFLTTSYTPKEYPNAIVIKDNDIVFFKRGNEYGLLKIICQKKYYAGGTLGGNMKYEWDYFSNNTGIIKKSIIKKEYGEIKDDFSSVGEIKRGTIKFNWSIRENGFGYLYPGSIEKNLNPPVEVKVINNEKFNDEVRIIDIFK